MGLKRMNQDMHEKTIEQLRNQFEYQYYSKMFDLKRNHNTGQYLRPTTFQAWCAYKLCASLNGILPSEFDIFSKEAD